MSNLENAVADLIIKATSAAEAAGRFAVEQLPDIAQQYVLYKGIISLFMLLVCLVILGLVITAFFITNKKIRNDEWESEAWIMYFLVSFFPMLVVFIEGSSALKTAVLAFVAPKILLIQWAAELVK